MKSFNRTPILYVENHQAEASILVGRALTARVEDDHDLSSAKLAYLDQLQARVRDYRLAAIDRSMGAGRPESLAFTEEAIARSNDPTATQYNDERDLPPVDINRAELVKPLILSNEDARLVLDGLKIIASRGDEFERRQIELFLEEQRLDTPANVSARPRL